MIFLLFILIPLHIEAASKFGRVNIDKRAQKEMIGMDIKDLYFCAGFPDNSETIDNLQFVTYHSGRDLTAYGCRSSNDTGVSITKKRYCVINIVLENNRIIKIDYTVRTGGLLTKGEQCAYALEYCIPEYEPQSELNINENKSDSSIVKMLKNPLLSMPQVE